MSIVLWCLAAVKAHIIYRAIATKSFSTNVIIKHHTPPSKKKNKKKNINLTGVSLQTGTQYQLNFLICLLASRSLTL